MHKVTLAFRPPTLLAFQQASARVEDHGKAVAITTHSLTGRREFDVVAKAPELALHFGSSTMCARLVDERSRFLVGGVRGESQIVTRSSLVHPSRRRRPWLVRESPLARIGRGAVYSDILCFARELSSLRAW
jgi:hypothetical protein